MNLSDTEFDYILQNGESYYVEFKERVNSALSREIIAFANASGGKIYLGVNDQGEPVGIEVSNKLKSQIQDIANNCNPAVTIHLHEFKNVLIVEAPEGKDKPYQCSDGFFIRMGANAQKMNRDRIVEFLQAEGQVRFEEQLHKKYDISKDFLPQKLKGYLEMAGITSNLDVESLLINLGVAEKLDGKLRMNNAGVLFFTESIQLLCEQATITCGVFDGTERIQVLNRKDYTMDMVSNINSTLHFIKQELRVKYEMTGTASRREIYEIPLDAFREAVINAIMHRDYFLFGSHVTVDIFDDRIEIGNPGGLPKGLKEEEFGNKSVRRNPLIAALLHRINLVENMGTGIGKIKTLLQKANAPEPRFEFGEFFTIIFPRPGKFMNEDKQQDSAKGSEKSSEKGSEKSSEKIIKLIRMEPSITTDQLAENIGISTRAVEKHLQNLKEVGVLLRIGGRKEGYWQVVK
jgi:ATP-dependent DNA helicase RecG